MSTTNTDNSWYWYVRKKGRNWVLGLVDDTGVATATADLDIEYWYDETPDEISSDDDTLPIPQEFEHAFAMGVVYEIMRMHGKEIRSYKRDFEQAIYDAIHKNIQESQQPATLSPYDLRMDDETIGTKQRTA